MTPLRRKLLRDIRRHRAQFVAIAVTMFLGVSIFAATYDSFRNLQASYATTATEFNFANLTAAGGDPEAFAATATATPGVAAVDLRSVVDAPLRVGEVKLLGRAIGVPAVGQPPVNRLEILEGAYLAAGANEGVLIEQHMADHFELGVGDSIDILITDKWRNLFVAGVVASPEYIWPAWSRQELITTPDNFGVVFVVDSVAAEISGGPNEVAVLYADGEPDEALSESLRAAARTSGATNVYTRAEQPSNAALEEDLPGFEEMAVFFPMLFLTAAAMAAYVMISRLVHTQRPHIGVLLANGFTRRQVLIHYLGYGIVPGLVGAIPGALVGVWLARVITRLYTELLSIPVTLVQFYPLTLVGAVAFGLVASVLAALAPALVASRVGPAEAMRGETPTGSGRTSVFERLIPPLRRLPVAWRMTLRGVGRNPRRTSYTVIGVVLSLMLVLVSWGMIDTVQHLMDRQFVEIQQEDATVYFVGSASSADVATLADTPGVARVEPTLTMPVSLRSESGSYDTALTVLADDTTMHRLISPDGAWFDLPDSGIVVGSATKALLGIEVGDPVTAEVEGLGSVATTVAGFVAEPLGTAAYIGRGHAETLATVALPANAAFVSYEDGADPAAVRSAITDRADVAAFEDAKALYAMVQDYMVLFYAFVGIMLVFGAAMAFALIFNSMSVNIAERTREVATLLAVGTDRHSISRYISTENLLVAMLGIPIGLVVGYFAARSAMASFSSDLFAFDLYIKPTTFLWASLAIVIVALVSQVPGLRAIRRINIPKVVKERSA